MDELKPLAVFAQVVDAGSMSAAARKLGMSPSAVSQVVRGLEQQSGVTLLHRSTRKLALSEAGERYYPHCKRLLEAAEAAAAALRQARDAPTGELRVSAPVGFANHIAPALAPLLIEAPQLSLRLLVDDAMIDLIDARIDLAIRAGKLADSSWVARRLGDFQLVLCAAPEYLARHGTPTTPEQLLEHEYLSFSRDSAAAKSQPSTVPLELLDANGDRHRVELRPRISSNNQVAVQQLYEQGLGIAQVPHADVAPALKRGALVRVLPDYRFAPLPLWAVTPKADAAEAAKVRAALDYLRRHFSAWTFDRK